MALRQQDSRGRRPGRRSLDKIRPQQLVRPFSRVCRPKIAGAPEIFHGKVPVDSGLGWYLQTLYEQGVLGPGKQIDSAPLPMDQWGELSFRLALMDAIARRVGIGDALAEGCCRAAEKWGRLETDKDSGALRLPAWGATSHWTMPWVDWAYGYILGAGDQTWHGFMAPVGTPRGGITLEEVSDEAIQEDDSVYRRYLHVQLCMEGRRGLENRHLFSA